MNDQKKINYLVTWLSSAFIIISIFTYFLTDNKEEWYFKLLNNLVPELLGPLIAILFIFYAFTKRGINIFEPDKTDNTPKYTISIADIPAKSFGIKITSHNNNSKIDRMSEFRGSFENLPKNIKIRIYVVNENQSVCWINSQNVITNYIDKTWQSTVYVGGVTSSGASYYMVVAIEDEATEQWVEYYKQVSVQLNDWKPFKYPLPKSIVEVEKIKVIRI